MKKQKQIAVAALFATVLAGGALIRPLAAADAKPSTIEDVMKAYHKAPKGVDPVCKHAVDGKATPEEINNLIAGYKVMAAAKAPKGDEASWKEKTTKLLAAAEGLKKGGPEAAAKYKEALNCKACHSAHKPD